MDGTGNVGQYYNPDSEKSNVPYVDEMFKFVYTCQCVCVVVQRVNV